MVTLSATGEVAEFLDVDQFLPHRSYYECGFFSVAVVRGMNQPGQPPLLTAAQMAADVEFWYASDYGGDNSDRNCDGMSLQQLYDLLDLVGLHYVPIDNFTNIDLIRAWIKQGFPVIVAGAEVGMYDIGLGDVNPYGLWYPQGNHIITLTGVRSDGNFLVRDTANVWPDYFTLRSGPRVYDASKLQLISATAIIPPWLRQPPSGYDPRKDTPMPNTPTVPKGWKDDGNTLTAPNGHKVIRGFRQYVLNHEWNPDNFPLQEEVALNPVEESNSSLGAGTQQVFRWTTLEWTPSRGVIVAYVGQELMKVRADRDALKAQVAQLQAKLNQGQTPPAKPLNTH